MDLPWSNQEIANTIAREAVATPGLYEFVRDRIERATQDEPGDPRIRFDTGEAHGSSDEDDKKKDENENVVTAIIDGARIEPYGIYGPSSRPTRAEVSRLLRRSDVRAAEGSPRRDALTATWIAGGDIQSDEDARERGVSRESLDAHLDAFAASRTPITMTVVSEGIAKGSFADWGVWSGSLRAVRVSYERDGIFGSREPLAVPAHFRVESSSSNVVLRAATGAAGGAQYIVVITWSALASTLIAWLLATPLVVLLRAEILRRRTQRRRSQGRCIACGYRLGAP